MQASDIPSYKFPVPFANGASGTTGKTVPIPTATTGTSRASLADGFPPQTFLAIGAGGTPPDGRDFNGLLFEISGWSRWQQAGGPIVYDAAFSTAIGGYPKGAVISTNPAGGLWLSTAENNTTDPDAAGAGWVSLIPTNLVKATVPECIAGVNDAHYVTPLGLRGAIDAGPLAGVSLTSNGYYTLPGGLIVQWGGFGITGPGSQAVSFPEMFPGTCFSCQVGGGNNSASQDNQISLISSSLSQSGFSARYVPSGFTTGFFTAWGI